MNDNRIQLNGIKVHPFPSDSSLLEYVEEHKGILVAINAEKILHANEQIQNIVNRNIGYCDGIGAVMAVRQHGAVDAVKIAGCELWLKIITALYQKEKTFYLVGSKQPVIEKTISRLKEDFPGIQITGYRNGYIQTETEQEELIEDIKTKQPDVIFVAMGSPKQELLMEKMYQAHPAIYQGLGGSFDVYTGNVKRAPEWWIKHNLEFAYRLLKQPSRIKRQIHLIKFLILAKDCRCCACVTLLLHDRPVFVGRRPRVLKLSKLWYLHGPGRYLVSLPAELLSFQSVPGLLYRIGPVLASLC